MLPDTGPPKAYKCPALVSGDKPDPVAEDVGGQVLYVQLIRSRIVGD